jgi:hypothetical protein
MSDSLKRKLSDPDEVAAPQKQPKLDSPNSPPQEETKAGPTEASSPTASPRTKDTQVPSQAPPEVPETLPTPPSSEVRLEGTTDVPEVKDTPIQDLGSDSLKETSQQADVSNEPEANVDKTTQTSGPRD